MPDAEGIVGYAFQMHSVFDVEVASTFEEGASDSPWVDWLNSIEGHCDVEPVAGSTDVRRAAARCTEESHIDLQLLPMSGFALFL